MNNNYLQHYGVLGMKWGVHRASKSGTNLKKSKYDGWSSDAKDTAALKKKKPYQLTNEELRRANNRMQLESQYKQLNKKGIAKGLAYVAAGTYASNTLYNYYKANSNLIRAGKDAIELFIKRGR